MLLKRLELQGFKSFVDKTVLDFGAGVTGVVGPNGSGKSNISDAIKWVMGEMSAKSLRGSNMQDVIFAGTEKRKPVNYAEVSLVLDNSEHIFPVDYDEVVVTRRVFRSGETAYMINRTNCRLRDIHELFMDTGLGRDGYSMIGQGSVAQILSTKAEDRRNLFEEAAGVSKYKYKREEAQRKLNSTEDNLVRINDITTELESQLTPLKNQSEKARKYLVLYDEFKGLDVTMAVSNIDKNAILKEEADKLHESVADELAEMREKESETEEQISSLYAGSTEVDAELSSKNEELIEDNNKIMELRNDIAVSETNIRNNEAAKERAAEEIEAEKQRISEKQKAIQLAELEKQASEDKIKALEEEFSDLRTGEAKVNDRIAAADAKIAELRAALLSHRNEAAASKMRIKGIDDLSAALTERKDAIESEMDARKRGTEETKAEIERLTEELAGKREKNDKLTVLIDKAKAEHERISTEAAALLNECNTLKVDFNSSNSKYRMLYDMEQEYDGYARSVKAVLKADELKNLAIYGTVAGLIEVKKEYAVAIETALGGAMQNIIVETEEDAKSAIGYLRRSGAGRATFLPISSVKGRPLDDANKIAREAGFIGIASELIGYNSRYNGIFANLLGRVVVVDNIDNAIAMSRKYGYKFRVVTLLGDIMNSGGSMSGGSVNKNSGFLSRAAELKELKLKIAKLEKQLAEKTDEYNSKRDGIKAAQDRIEMYSPTAHEYETEIIRIENTLKHLNDRLNGGSEADSGLAAELEDIMAKLDRSSDETVEILTLIRNAENAAKETEEKIQAAQDEQEEAEADKQKNADSLMEYTLRLQELKRDIIENDSRRATMTEEIERSRQVIELKHKSVSETGENSKLLTESIEEKKKTIAELEAGCEKLRSEIRACEERKSSIVKKLQEIQSSNKELTDKLLQLQQELSRAEAKQARLETERENIINRLWEDYELTYSDAAQHKIEIDNEKEASKRLAELKGKIKALGSVNMDSIEEYKAVSERYEFLSTQKEDLEKSKENLNKIIESMEEMMENHFSEQFNQISESFGTVFRELFGGGRGRLYLSDPDNVLQSGIEIDVQLPGKGLQNINLYSGGEKSFIAIAILFAILKVKPTPFCILDEIDAALDDVNVSRFATYLKHYLDRSQFIVITHRRGTMEAANIIYGVTMQEKGVSKLLSLHIDDVEEELR